VPGYDRAELTAELTIASPPGAGDPPREPVEAVREAAAGSGLARESGPESVMLVGGRREVLEATMRVVEAALDAGAHAVEVKVESEGDAPRFGG
jgi:hypothetical protein